MADDRYQYYWDERHKAIKASNDSAQIFDKSVITLASILLVASMGFAAWSGAASVSLVAGCISFLLSLTAILFSFLFSASAYRRYIAYLDEDYLDKNEAGGEIKYTNVWSAVTGASNWVSAVALIAGIIIIVYELARRAT